MNLGAPIAEGNTAKIYLDENRVVKVYDYLSDQVAIFEATKQKYAYSCGLPVPKIIEVTKVDGRPAIIMEYIKGKTLGEMALANEEKMAYYMNISVEVQLEIHSMIPNKIESMNEKLYRQIKDTNRLNPKQKNKILKKLDSYSYEKRLCHGDFHLFNLIQSDNQVIVIDWIDSSAGDIRADVYRTYLLYNQFSTELAEMYLRLYCDKSGLLRSEVFQWAPVIAAARLSENIPSDQVSQLMDIITSEI